MRVFVTGGNGFIGSVVTRKLIEKGYQTRCLLRESSKLDRIDDLPIERHIGDVTQIDTLREGLVGCDAIIHLASISNWNDINSPKMHQVVVDGSKNLLALLREFPTLKFVYVSSAAAVNGTKRPVIQNEDTLFELSPKEYQYAAAKRLVEDLCRRAAQEGLHTVIANPGEVYGPNDTDLITAGNLVDFATSTPVLSCHGGTSIVHVEDVAEGIIAAMRLGRRGERYILGGDNLSVRELAQLTLKLVGKENVPVINIPNFLLKSAAKMADNFGLPFPINPKVVPYATRFWMFSNEKSKRELKLQFRNAEDTLTPTLQWLKTAGHIQT